MNPRAQEHLEKILAKTPEELRDDEIGFLRARRSYLKPHQVKEFKSVLSQTPKGPVKKKNAKKEN